MFWRLASREAWPPELFIAQRLGRVAAGGSARRNIARYQRHGDEQDSTGSISPNVGHAYFIQQTLHQASQEISSSQSNGNSQNRQYETLPHYQPPNVARPGSQS